jgi:protein involved in polysaccharide export with SLBB domain
MKKSMPNLDSDKLETVSVVASNTAENSEKYFGYNYFKNDISFFDNIPTPADYKIGPGDEVIISLWGENNSRESFIINKDGTIYYPNIGFISLSNHTVESAEIMLIQQLSSVYATLKDKENPTKLMLSLGKLKSMNIYFSGNIENPGISLVHPFSDIFSAIVQSGGINDNGSLRDIKLIRNGKIVATVDFYSFFMDGKKKFSNIKLVDGDLIHIPSVKKRVSIKGEVNRPSTYELLPNESISDIVIYASGYTSDASSTLILNQIIPINKRSSNDNARTSVSIDLKNQESIILNNGDNIFIPPITFVDLSVQVYGRVKSPGVYPGANTTLKNVLDIAGGFEDPIFRKTIREDIITILRQDENKFYSNEIVVDYKNADQFKLEVNDKIFVYEDINYNNNFTYRVEGEVYKPGTYAISGATTTVREALSLAGGLTELSSVRNIYVLQEFTQIDDFGEKFTTSEIINNVTLDFKLGINSVVIASPLENVVRVEGNVYNPGLITYSKGSRFPRYIELAGGYKRDTLKRDTYIKRANGNVEKVNGYFISRGKKIYPGDTIVVPVNPEPSDFDMTSFISDLSTTLANIAAILLIVENQKD